jgi:peptidoglycan/LPS O-acetylase OafA/YrhL
MRNHSPPAVAAMPDATTAASADRRDIREAGYLPYIDGLRAVAVLSVIAYHLDSAWLPGGFTGVDIFFVISGFVVSASVDRLPPLDAAASMLRFYARRLRRIAPALVACLLATCVASGLFIPQAWLNDTSQRTGLMAFFGLSNWILAGTGNDYFSPKAEFNPYTHTWSLGVEEQFYLLFPLMFLAWTRGGRLRRLSTVLFGVGLIGSLAHAMRSGGADGVGAFYLTGSRFWQLAAGVLLYQAMAFADERRDTMGMQEPTKPLALRRIGLIASAALLIAGLAGARAGHSPWPDGLLPVVGTLGVLGLVYRHQHGWLGRLLSHRPVVAVGRVSYSLYLWHWPVFVLFRWTVGLESMATKALALSLAIVLAVASYRWVERPLRRAPGLLRMPNWRFVAVAVAVIATCGFGYTRLTGHAQAYSLSTVSRDAADWYPRGEPVANASCGVDQHREPVGAIVAWHYARTGCRTSTRRLFVAGDSHAAAYVEMLQRFVLDTGDPVTLYAEGGCPLVSLHPARERVPACRLYSGQALADVAAKARRGDVLFLPALRLPRLAEQWALMDEGKAMRQVFGRGRRAERRRAEAAAIARLRPLARRGVHIVLEAPPPLFRAPAYRCSDWFNSMNPICERGLDIDRDFLERYREPTVDALHRIASRLPGASVWDPFPILCPQEPACSAFRGGHPLFFDGDHLSGYANRLLLPDFSRHVAAIPAKRPRKRSPQ